MSTSYVFCVGQPGHGKKIIASIRKSGYKAGLLMDIKKPCKYATEFDRVIKCDFSDMPKNLQVIDSANLSIVGLLCTYENYIVAKSQIAHHLGVPSLSETSAAACTDKVLMRAAFSRYNHSITPEFQEVQHYVEAVNFCSKYGFPVILKPANLVKSLLVLRCDTPEELTRNYKKISNEITGLYRKYSIFNRQPKIIIEEFMQGEMFSVAAFVDKSGEIHFCNDVTRLITAQSIRRSDNYLFCRSLPSGLTDELQAELYRITKAGVQALGMTSSPVHAELIIDSKGRARIVEIGARIGGYRTRMYALSYGVDLTAAEIALAVGERPSLDGALQKYTAVFEIFPKTTGRFRAIQGLPPKTNFYYYSLKVSPGDIAGTASDGYKAACIIIVSTDNKDTYNKTTALVEAIEIEVTP